MLSSDATLSDPGPIITTEMLTDEDVRTERIMLGLRLAEGIPLQESPEVTRVIDKYVDLGLLERGLLESGRGSQIRLTEPGRYLADGIVTDIIVAQD